MARELQGVLRGLLGAATHQGQVCVHAHHYPAAPGRLPACQRVCPQVTPSCFCYADPVRIPPARAAPVCTHPDGSAPGCASPFATDVTLADSPVGRRVVCMCPFCCAYVHALLCLLHMLQPASVCLTQRQCMDEYPLRHNPFSVNFQNLFLVVMHLMYLGSECHGLCCCTGYAPRHRPARLQSLSCCRRTSSAVGMTWGLPPPKHWVATKPGDHRTPGTSPRLSSSPRRCTHHSTVHMLTQHPMCNSPISHCAIITQPELSHPSSANCVCRQ